MTAITNDITVMPVLKNYIACGQFITFSCFGLELLSDRLKSTDFTHQLHISCFTLVQLLLEALDLLLQLLSLGLQALYTLHEDNKHLQYLDLNYHYQTSVESTYVHNKLLIYVKLCIFMHCIKHRHLNCEKNTCCHKRFKTVLHCRSQQILYTANSMAHTLKGSEEEGNHSYNQKF